MLRRSWPSLLSCVRYLPVVSSDRAVITAGLGLLIQIRRHLRRLSYTCHRAIPQVIVRGPRFSLSCWYGRLPAAVTPSVFCTLCHGAYQYLTQLIRPFVLMEFSLTPAEARCFLWVRRSCLLGPWVEPGDRLRQTKVLGLAAAASTLRHFPFSQLTQKKNNAPLFNIHWLRIFGRWNNYFAKIIIAMHDFLAIQFNYIDKQPFQKQLEPDFNWTVSQLSFPLIWLSHFWIAFDDRTKQSRWDNHLHCDAALTPILRNTADLPCR